MGAGRDGVVAGGLRRDVDAVLGEFEDAASRQELPAFLAGHANCYDADMDTVVTTVRRLEGKGYTVVRPDRFLRLAEDALRRGLCGQ